MSELWQNLSFLSQQVSQEVREAPPPPRPTNAHLTSNQPEPSDRGSSQPRSPESQPDADGSPGRLGQETTECPLVLGSLGPVCSPTVTVAFCQEMTEKCTTEED